MRRGIGEAEAAGVGLFLPLAKGGREADIWACGEGDAKLAETYKQSSQRSLALRAFEDGDRNVAAPCATIFSEVARKGGWFACRRVAPARSAHIGSGMDFDV